MAPVKENPKAGIDRKHPRHKAPKWLCVGWRGGGQGTISQAETISMGGLFLHTPNPPSKGAVIDLLFDLQIGEVRARAVVRYQKPGQGMGVQFIQMQAAARARLTQFLARFSAVSAAPFSEPAGKVKRDTQPTPFARDVSQTPRKTETEDPAQFERELAALLEVSRTGTYYQLLGVHPDSPRPLVRQMFHGLARKFHPDHHMARKEWLGRLEELMAAATLAYKTLSDDGKRAQYDAHLASSGAYNLRRAKTVTQEIIEQSFLHANECLRAGNFVGSIVWLRKCTELSPDEARYHALLARSLSTVGQYYEEAIKEFERAIDLDRWNVETYMQCGQLFENMELVSRAREIYSQVLQINPQHAKARERLNQLAAA